MASTEAQVCNIALARIGVRDFIDDLSDATTEAEVANAYYAAARDSLLTLVEWRFATRRAALALLSGIEVDGWEYAYAAPSGCLHERFIYPNTRSPTAQERVAFAVEADATHGALILTDMEEASLVYTHQETAVARFPPLFVDALAWMLSAEFALALPVKPAVAVSLGQRFEVSLARARATEKLRGQEDEPPQAEHIRNR